MSRALITLRSKADRARAVAWIAQAGDLCRVELKGPARSRDQNSMLWELLSQLAVKLRWHGLKLSPTDWKDLLTASFRKEIIRTVPNVEGNGFVVLGMRTSDMTVPEMSDFLEFIMAFAAMQGVTFDLEAKAA